LPDVLYSGGLHASLEAFSVKVEPAPDEEISAWPRGDSHSIDVYHKSMVAGNRITFVFPAISESALRARAPTVFAKNLTRSASGGHMDKKFDSLNVR
jgi:hypothetical protein